LSLDSLTELYTLSLHDALPIFFFRPVVIVFDHFSAVPELLCYFEVNLNLHGWPLWLAGVRPAMNSLSPAPAGQSNQNPLFCEVRSEEHTSELQSRENLVCRLLL